MLRLLPAMIVQLQCNSCSANAVINGVTARWNSVPCCTAARVHVRRMCKIQVPPLPSRLTIGVTVRVCLSSIISHQCASFKTDGSCDLPAH